MTRVLVVGANGLLGHSVVRALSPHLDVWALTRQPTATSHLLARWVRTDHWIGAVDVGVEEELSRVIRQCQPDVIVNCAGVIKQRLTASREVWRINVELPHRLASLTHQVGARLIHASTDCVFAGTRGSYRECDDPDAVDLYGRSKAAGEPSGEHVITIRSSHVGFELALGPSLLSWAFSCRGTRVEGFANAKYSGVSAPTLARVIRMLIESDRPLSGTFHVASEPITKFDLLDLLNRRLELKLNISPVAEPVVNRTLDGSVFTSRTGVRIPAWDEMVNEIAGTRSDYPYASD